MTVLIESFGYIAIGILSSAIGACIGSIIGYVIGRHIEKIEWKIDNPKIDNSKLSKDELDWNSRNDVIKRGDIKIKPL